MLMHCCICVKLCVHVLWLCLLICVSVCLSVSVCVCVHMCVSVCVLTCVGGVCVLVPPTVLVANKADLEVGREVTTEEGQTLAKDLRLECLRCFYFEVLSSSFWL